MDILFSLLPIVILVVGVWGAASIMGYAPWFQDMKYSAKVEYSHTAKILYTELFYDITVTDKKTGESLTVREGRYPHIYGNERAWARLEARNIYNTLKTQQRTPGKFTL